MARHRSDAEILKLAQTQFQLAPTQDPPKGYLVELKNHLNIYPNDDHFRVVSTPKKGYGYVICLEDGCGSEHIDLDFNSDMGDGGKATGVGSLDKFRKHIVTHPTHGKKRQARLRPSISASSRKPSTSLTRVKAEPSMDTINLLDGRSSPSVQATTSASGASFPSTQNTPSSSFNSPTKSRSSLVRLPVKSEETSFSFKAPKTPLTPVDNNSFPSSSSSIAPRLPEASSHNDQSGPTLDVLQIRMDVNAVQNSITRIQEVVYSLENKFNKTKAEATRLRNGRAQLDIQKARKQELLNKLPRMSPLKPTTSFTGRENGNPSPLKREDPFSMTRHHIPPAFNASGRAGIVKPEIATSFAGASAFNLGRPPKPDPATQPPPSFLSASSSRLVIPGGLADSDDEMDLPGDRDPDVVIDGLMVRAQNVLPTVTPIHNDAHDENGDYYGRGKDTFQGPQARADDIDQFLKQAGNAEHFDGNASLDRALFKLGLGNVFTPLPGMEVALMPHQAIGVAWMYDKEIGDHKLKGGCLADDMGLGKTVQMIALMMKNPPEDPKCKTTLIIAPTALLDQWAMEIELKTNSALKCLVYHGSAKRKTKKELVDYDVIITTYGTLSYEWPDYEAEQKAKEKQVRKRKVSGGGDFIDDSSDSDAPSKTKKKSKKPKGMLFSIDFYRIVLDEAQNIRNRRTRISRAVTELQSEYRWCLTGTPIINSLADVYGGIRFLKVRPWYDWKEFQDRVGALEKKRPDLAMTRLQTIFQLYLLRRRKDSELDGKKLIELPKKTIELCALEFTQEERDIYDVVEGRMAAKFNRFLRAGTVLKNYHEVLVLLLRLRQVCSHPCLIQEEGQIAAFIAPDEVDDDWSPENREILSKARSELGAQWVTQMRQKLRTLALERIKAEKESPDATLDNEDCPICYDNITEGQLTKCGHCFCRDCIRDILQAPQPDQQNREEPKLAPKERHCPNCRAPISAETTFSRIAFEPSDADLESTDSDIEMEDAEATVSKKKGKARAKPKSRKKPYREEDDVIMVDSEDESEDDDDADDMDDFIVNTDEDEDEEYTPKGAKKALGKRKAFVILDSDEEDIAEEEKEVLFGRKKKNVSPEAIKLMPRFLPSTKMKKMMEIIQELAETKPDEKTLVISQWTSCLQLVSDYLSEKGIIHVKYQGNMTRIQRDAAVRVFLSRDKAPIMLMSQKCGGVGLNLVRANNVISLDLGWSEAMEAQAFDRVHRLGQTRNVHVNRLVIANTVEDRLLGIQQRKQALADGSLGEGSGKKMPRMTVAELASLFGLDAHGRRLTN